MASYRSLSVLQRHDQLELIPEEKDCSRLKVCRLLKKQRT